MPAGVHGGVDSAGVLILGLPVSQDLIIIYKSLVMTQGQRAETSHLKAQGGGITLEGKRQRDHTWRHKAEGSHLKAQGGGITFEGKRQSDHTRRQKAKGLRLKAKGTGITHEVKTRTLVDYQKRSR